MKKIIPKFILKISLLFIGIPAIFIMVLYFVSIINLCSHPTGIAHISIDYKKAIGKEFIINIGKKEILDRMRFEQSYNEPKKNLTDSLFVIYFLSEDSILNIKAKIRIIQDSQHQSIIKFDSVIGYFYPGIYDKSEIELKVNKWNSNLLVNQFFNNVIKELQKDSFNYQNIYFDNKLIMNGVKE